MRITIDILDEMHARLKVRAKDEGTTMPAIILRAIDAELAAEAPAPMPRRRFPTIPSTQPGPLKHGEEGVYEYIDFP
jgi:hypothetical protein